ncbi:deoxyribonuclease gamma-like [Conger conger]|uniref:deoxyribonuclease gamma-like n=1 Tax=Conger conger TaxID=82655 RepID=UPI002A5A7ED5|nr:deoxyribonuclease gamma-like [Conger conger]
MATSALLLVLCFHGALSLKICSFNIQTFGANKIAKPEVLDVILRCIARCDITLVMEIKDSKERAFPKLVTHLNRMSSRKTEEYSYVISERLGKNSYKEQYGFIYRHRLVSVKATYQYPDMQSGDEDVFSREPFVVWFQSHQAAIKDFVIIPIHTTPDTAVREIDELYDVYQDVKQQWTTAASFVIMGDFNAACGYVPKKSWGDIRLRSDSSFRWLIGDRIDTTVKQTTDCAYDRIVLRGESLIQAVSPGSVEVFDFKAAYGLTETQALAVSDHFPVAFSVPPQRGKSGRRY